MKMHSGSTKMCYPNHRDGRRREPRRGRPAGLAAAAAVLVFPAVVTGRPSSTCFVVPSASTSANRRMDVWPSGSQFPSYMHTHAFSSHILHSASVNGSGDGTDANDGLTAQERILREAGLSPETPEERAERLRRRTEAKNELKAAKRTNVVVAALAFLAALLNYGWQYTHPVTPIQVLAEMQSQSAPLDVIGRNGRPTLLEFWAPWCGNCRMAAPTLQAVEKEYEGKVNFVMVNADQGSAWPLVERFGVDAIPHLAMISAEGDVETALIGPIPRGVLRADLDALLDNAAKSAGKKSCDVLVPASSTDTEAMASSTVAVADGGAGINNEGGIQLPYDVPTVPTSAAAVSSGGSATCDERKKEELPYVMLDVFRSRPGDRRVTF
jgi:thiol-disulfide isomerase/thioredoxin